ncbi:MAG: hypothetical protein RMJ44_10510 [Cytophagales bacterium]|nr:hypothetical protein [Bernardetiaceae bacterium]MDW8211505.1 hypothetical protein [Cytophagales bacterium]
MKILHELLKSHVQAFIESHLYEDVASLALKKSPFPEIAMPLLVEQIQAKRKAKTKLPTWFARAGIVFPPAIHLEQSSSETAARFKSTLLQGHHLVDLTGGFGVDATFFADCFSKVDYVEQNEQLAQIAAHNFQLLGKDNIRVWNTDALSWLQQTASFPDAVYMDPSRRTLEGTKVIRLCHCQPDVRTLLPLLVGKTKQVLLKLSPMADWQASLQELEQASPQWKTDTIIVVAINNQCKELLFLLKPVPKAEPLRIQAVHLHGNRKEILDFSPEEERNAVVSYAMPESFFCEPNGAILKAGAFKTIAQRFHLKKLHPHTHLYTSHQCPEDFPGRVFGLKAICKAERRAIASHLPHKKALIAVRNFPATSTELYRRWQIAEGGTVYLFATTLADGKKAVLIGEKI